MTAPTTRETADHAELAACPFCGGSATIERFGNTRVSTQYQCDDCGCFLETGEEFHHGRAWNRRPREEALLSEIAALRGEHKLTLQDGSEAWCSDAAWRWFQGWAVRLEQAERQRDELRKALEEIADEAPYRSGYCQSDVEYGPALSADEMQAVARQALANQGAE